jgi:hypothetical protein
MPNRRVGKDGAILWSGDGVFAAADRRIALVYTCKRARDFHQGINLIDKLTAVEPVQLYVYGGDSEAEALDNLYGPVSQSVGYIYRLNKGTFNWEVGLGQMEVVSRVPPKAMGSPNFPNGIEIINPRAEIQRYFEQGKLKIHWRPILSRIK